MRFKNMDVSQGDARQSCALYRDDGKTCPVYNGSMTKNEVRATLDVKASYDTDFANIQAQQRLADKKLFEEEELEIRKRLEVTHK